jgi:hypothetical protein
MCREIVGVDHVYLKELDPFDKENLYVKPEKPEKPEKVSKK